MAKVITDKEKITALFSRHIATIFPSRERVQTLLSSGKRLTFYLGIDPTGPDLHLGHTTNLLVLKKLIGLGHKVILLIGDFTAQTGDPSDKDATRKVLTAEEVGANMKTYLKQATKILPKGSFEVKYNSKWLAKLTFADVRKLARRVTVQQTIARDMFQKRLAENKPITVEEFLYPLMQGYDSVAMAVDGEVGGADQTFNMLVGRDLVKTILDKEKIVITTKLLEDSQTGKKIMNKSEGRYVSLNDSPQEMFGKTMALPDSAILPIFSYATELPDQKIAEVERRLSGGENPKTLKEELAYELVKTYHGEKEAQKAQEEFERVFSQKELPLNIAEFKVEKPADIVEVMMGSGLAASKSEARRLIEQGGVTLNDQTVNQWRQELKPGDILKVGPRRFLKIT
mgnify:CR=1 FL=1